MKNYTITVNGNVYDVTVEENTNGAPAAAPAPRAAAPAPAPAAKPQTVRRSHIGVLVAHRQFHRTGHQIGRAHV